MQMKVLRQAEQRAAELPVTGDLSCLGFASPCASAWVDSWGLLRLCCLHRYCLFRHELRAERTPIASSDNVRDLTAEKKT